MKKSTKRFLFPIVLLLIDIIYLIFMPDGYNDFIGAISTIIVFIVFPLFIITLIWAIVGAYNDHQLEKQGIPVSDELFPFISKYKKALEAEKEEDKNLSPQLIGRKSKYRKIGLVLAVLGFFMLFMTIIGTIIGTLMLIGGLSLFYLSSPNTYNSHVDNINMMANNSGNTLDKIYEAFKNYNTILGSVYRGTTFPHCPALFWGEGEVLFYVYISKDGLVYTGLGANVGCKKLSEPLHQAKEYEENDFQDALCWNLEYHNFEKDFSEVIHHYLETEEVLPLPEYKKGNIYFFEEDFKLTGQRFYLYNSNKEVVYSIEGTYPLKTFHIYDENNQEIFKVSKQIVNIMPHYLFYQNDELIGEFVQEVDITHDIFTMDLKEGHLEMRSLSPYIGANYIVKLNDKRIGSIAEKLNLTIENIVFDNMVITVYDHKNLALMAALGIMATRELVRDRNDEI